MAFGEPAKLAAYLARIGLARPPALDLAGLSALLAAHLERIPYENLDVQLGRKLGLSLDATFAKLVTGRRGGWCYEMNGLLGWALGELGFAVRAVAGGVERDKLGDETIGNHLVLLVDLDRTYLVDAGLGDGPNRPLPLIAGDYRIGWRQTRLYQIEDGWWRFQNYPGAFASAFDFRDGPCDHAALARANEWLQIDPESPFLQNAVVLRQEGDAILSLTGRVLKRQDAAGADKSDIASAADYRRCLAEGFGLDLAAVDAERLWPKILDRHTEWLRARESDAHSPSS